jgi:hypothetical protein
MCRFCASAEAELDDPQTATQAAKATGESVASCSFTCAKWPSTGW